MRLNCVSIEKSISSLQIGFNVPLKDSKYKTSEQCFQNDLFWGGQVFLCHKSLMHRSAKLQRKVYIWVMEGSSEWVGEFAIVSNNQFIMLRIFTG